MTHDIPKPIRDAQQKGVEYFEDESFEWKLDFESSSEHIEKTAGRPVLVFANNGYGDFLFLKKSLDDTSFDEEVFEFFHEESKIYPIKDDLETLLGLKERPPSTDNYPKAIYETGEGIQLGDRVKIKIWAEFWKGWQEGVVKYVPGISKRKPANEHDGLKWIEVKFQNGSAGCLIDNRTGKVRKLKFVSRSQT
jgi:hypothetical protein